MRLAEIKKDQPLIVTVVNQLLSKHTVYMWVVDRNGGDVEVEVDSVERYPTNPDLFIVHYGIPNERTGDITNWTQKIYDADKMTVTDEGGKWWLHEVD